MGRSKARPDVGRCQSTMQRRWKIHPVDGKALFQAFHQACRGRGIVLVQPCGKFFDASHAFFWTQLQGGAQHALGLRPLVLGLIVEQVTQLVGSSALYRLIAAEDRAQRR